MIKVMIVEDEPSARERYAHYVEAYGHAFSVVATCAGASGALAALSSAKPDVILTDIKMPDMSGLSMLAELRSRGWSGTAVIISGYDDFSFARDALRLGVQDYLLKPIFPEDISRLLAGIEAKGFPGAGESAHRILAELGVDFDALPPFLRKAIGYAEKHHDSHVSLADAADAACVSEPYLSAAFSSHCSTHFVDFLHRLRVEAAKELLSGTDMSLDAIAERVGLGDSSYLNRVFKKVTGTTPGRYRHACTHGGERRLSEA